MEVRLLTSLVSPDGSWIEGDVYTCDEGTALRLIASGQAVPTRVGRLELAISDAPGIEVAAKRTSRRRRV